MKDSFLFLIGYYPGLYSVTHIGMCERINMKGLGMHWWPALLMMEGLWDFHTVRSNLGKSSKAFHWALLLTIHPHENTGTEGAGNSETTKCRPTNNGAFRRSFHKQWSFNVNNNFLNRPCYADKWVSGWEVTGLTVWDKAQHEFTCLLCGNDCE